MQALTEDEVIRDVRIPYELRLKQATTVMELANRMDIDARILCLQALRNWVHRNKQQHLALMIEEKCNLLNRRLSQGMLMDQVS